MLPGPDATYVVAAASTVEDLAALAPRTAAGTRPRVEEADPQLDADLAAWYDPAGGRARLSVLGPVEFHAGHDGKAPQKRRAFFIEFIAYLAARPDGVTSEQIATDWGIGAAKARSYAGTVRDWLGSDPVSGNKLLPEALKSAAGTARGHGIYQVHGLLTDADLFRRLRLRGQARGGPDGVADLLAAIRLVRGVPYAQLRRGEWLVEGQRDDHYLTLAIVDVAHLITTAALAAGDTTTAREATEKALSAAPDEEITHLDMAAIHEHDTDAATAVDYLRRALFDPNTEHGLDDPPERTEAIITTRGWDIRAS